jgi:electron transfer flavoprotein beta subunit
MNLHIIVCIKSVLLRAPKGRTIRMAESCELNPFDRPTLAAALGLKKKYGGSVTVLSMGPESGSSALYEATALGADRSILICDPALSGSDTLATSTVLGAAIKKLEPFDFLFFGTRTSDSDTGHVGPQTAVLLGVPLASQVQSMELGASGLTAERKMDGVLQKLQVQLPAAITVHQTSYPPGDPPLSGIQAAFEESRLEKWGLTELSLPPESAGEIGSPTRVLSMTPVSRERKCRILTGAPEGQADQLLKTLMDSGVIS